MFLTTHAAAGILISQLSPSSTEVFAYAFLSHFVLDFIPHGDDDLYRDHEWKIQRRYRRVVMINAADLGALTGLALWAAARGSDGGLIAIGILGSILPDFLSYLFPVLHQRLRWLFLIRWLYAATKPTGLRYLVRGQNWFHRILHHEVIRRDISFQSGLLLQGVLVVIFLALAR